MEVTIIGNNGGYPRENGTGMGMLIQNGADTILFECGPGVVSKLQKFVPLHKIETIVISHLHADHFSDLGVYRYAIQTHARDKMRNKQPKLYLPEGSIEKLDVLFGRISENYEIISISENSQFSEGKFILSFMEVPHSKTKKCYAVKVETSSKRIVYSGDTGYCDALKEFAVNADLFLCEAGVEERFKEFGYSKHLTPRQAAEIAMEANVKQLLLTHIYPLTSYEVIKTEAQKVLADAKIAIEGKTYSV